MPGKKGLFITFEGTEGCGKTTQVSLLADNLAQKRWEVVVTREPGGTDFGCRLREILLTGDSGAISPRAEIFLYCADRAQHVHSVIIPALQQGKCVICDRFADASVAYQGWGRGLALEEVEKINAIACAGIVPDLTIFLDIDPEIGLRRAVRRNRESRCGEDRFESEGLDFHRRVRQGYLANAHPQRFRVVSAEGTPQEVHHRVLKLTGTLMANE